MGGEGEGFLATLVAAYFHRVREYHGKRPMTVRPRLPTPLYLMESMAVSGSAKVHRTTGREELPADNGVFGKETALRGSTFARVFVPPRLEAGGDFHCVAGFGFHCIGLCCAHNRSPTLERGERLGVKGKELKLALPMLGARSA
jgi:hypothetical protein